MICKNTHDSSGSDAPRYIEINDYNRTFSAPSRAARYPIVKIEKDVIGWNALPIPGRRPLGVL